MWNIKGVKNEANACSQKLPARTNFYNQRKKSHLKVFPKRYFLDYSLSKEGIASNLNRDEKMEKKSPLNMKQLESVVRSANFYDPIITDLVTRMLYSNERQKHNFRCANEEYKLLKR